MSRLEDRRAEHVDADQGQVAGRVLRLLDQTDDAVAVQLRDPVRGGVVDLGQQDQRVGLVALKTSTSSTMPSRSRLSPRYMTNELLPR